MVLTKNNLDALSYARFLWFALKYGILDCMTSTLYIFSFVFPPCQRYCFFIVFLCGYFHGKNYASVIKMQIRN